MPLKLKKQSTSEQLQKLTSIMEAMKLSFDTKLNTCTQDISQLKCAIADVKQCGDTTAKQVSTCTKTINDLKSAVIAVTNLGEKTSNKLDKNISDLKTALVNVKQHGETTATKLDASVNDMRESFDAKLDACNPRINSLIIRQEDETHVIAWLNSVGKTSISKRLYRASIDGWEGKHFHGKCDNKGATLTVIKSQGGYSFGGYIDSSWHSNKAHVSSSKAFLFSLHCHDGLAPTKFDLKRARKNYAAYGDSNYGPIFGIGNDICISRNANANTNSHTNGNTYKYPSEVDPQTFLTGSKNFQVLEVEVFLVT